MSIDADDEIPVVSATAGISGSSPTAQTSATAGISGSTSSTQNPATAGISGSCGAELARIPASADQITSIEQLSSDDILARREKLKEKKKKAADEIDALSNAIKDDANFIRKREMARREKLSELSRGSHDITAPADHRDKCRARYDEESDRARREIRGTRIRRNNAIFRRDMIRENRYDISHQLKLCENEFKFRKMAGKVKNYKKITSTSFSEMISIWKTPRVLDLARLTAEEGGKMSKAKSTWMTSMTSNLVKKSCRKDQKDET